MSKNTGSLSYRDAGVDIDAGNALVDQIKHIARRTRRPEVMAGLGGFGALCQIPPGFKEPVLVSGTDGVGTKLKLAIELNCHNTIGIDLVAMCVNDLIVCGAEPLFFLDYYATGKLNVDMAASVVNGIGKGCELAGCSLVGGETAEMPGMYQGKDYDLAGFCVGVVEKSRIIDGSAVREGDALIALASSGAHSNGYSLIRKILEVNETDLSSLELINNLEPASQQTLAEQLLEPTRIYVKPVLELIRQDKVHAISHITGGGLLENIPRVLPSGTRAVINTGSWDMPPLFLWLQQQGNVEQKEMFRTFNCGAGMVIAVARDQKHEIIEQLTALGEIAWEIGHIASADSAKETVELAGL